MTRVRFGLIGCSSIARRRMAPAICASDMARLERVGSRAIDRAEQFACEFRCTKWGSYEAVLADPEVDAVYISTPPALHEPWARAAAEHGKHILCEKPAFSNRRVAAEVIKLCRLHNVRLMEGYTFSYHPQHKLVRSLLDAGHIGELRIVQSEFTFPQPAAGNFRLQRELGGGVFLDAAGYPVAAAMLLYQAMPVSIFCHVKTDAVIGVDNLVSMTLNFPGGGTSQLLSGYGFHYRSRYVALGTKGRLETTRAFSVPPDMKTEIIVETAAGSEIISVPPADQFQLMIKDFCAQVTQSAAPPGIFEEKLLRQHTVMETAWRSHLQQHSVLLPEFAQ
jgi:NDP-hexose-3-ketoreductase